MNIRGVTSRLVAVPAWSAVNPVGAAGLNPDANNVPITFTTTKAVGSQNTAISESVLVAYKGTYIRLLGKLRMAHYPRAG